MGKIRSFKKRIKKQLYGFFKPIKQSFNIKGKPKFFSRIIFEAEYNTTRDTYSCIKFYIKELEDWVFLVVYDPDDCDRPMLLGFVEAILQNYTLRHSDLSCFTPEEAVLQIRNIIDNNGFWRAWTSKVKSHLAYEDEQTRLLNIRNYAQMTALKRRLNEQYDPVINFEIQQSCLVEPALSSNEFDLVAFGVDGRVLKTLPEHVDVATIYKEVDDLEYSWPRTSQENIYHFYLDPEEKRFAKYFGQYPFSGEVE